MLTPKNIASPTGASSLASLMAGLSTGMDVYELDLRTLEEAPASWNFYRPLPDAKFLELVASIEQNGLISPLVVWDRGDHYVLLSGHNRRRAMLHLAEKLRDVNYLKAHCVIKRDLSEDDARGILIDANWVQRTLSPSEKARSIYHKYISLSRLDRGSYQRRYDLVAEHFGLKATQVYQYYRLSTLEEEWLRRLDDGVLSIKAAVKLAALTPAQRAVLAERPLTNAMILDIDARESAESIACRLDAPAAPATRAIVVPAQHYEMCSALVDEYLKRWGRHG